LRVFEEGSDRQLAKGNVALLHKRRQETGPEIPKCDFSYGTA
jgi:hypothetical protein